MEKLDGAFPDFIDEADRSLDRILDSISASNLPLPKEKHVSHQNDIIRFDNYYSNKISETCNDILLLEKNAATIVQADIENLYKGSFVREFATHLHISEDEAREKLRLELAGQLHSWGMKCINKRHYPLPREIKHIIRMDFYGTIDKIDERKDSKSPKKLSDIYRHRNPKETIEQKPGNYDLSQSPVWMIFRQFRSFRLLEKNLPELLIKEGITPQDVKRLNAYDFSQILYNRYINQSKPDAEKDKRANLFLGAKYRFVKAFIRRNKTALRRIMDMRGYDPRYTETLIRHMEQYGVTGGFDVLEKNYTPEMLEQLKKHKIVPDNIQAGDEITDKQASDIRAAGLIGIILARDENGNPVTGPELTVHHKIAVQDSSEKINFAEVNQFKNLCLIIEPYHFFAHSLDRTGTDNHAEYYVSRIEIDDNIAFYGGFNKLFQIECDFGQTHNNQYNKDVLDHYRNQQLLLEKDDDYWHPKSKTSRNEKKRQKKQKKKQEHLNKILQEMTDDQNSSTPSQAQIIEKKSPDSSGKKEKKRAVDAQNTQTKEKNKPHKNLQKRIKQITHKKDEYLKLRNELLKKRKQYLTLRAAKKSAIETISQFEDEQKFEKLIQYTRYYQGHKK